MRVSQLRPQARSRTFRIAASDSPASEIASADYLCDGVADEAEFNEAYGRLHAQGGTIAFAEGTYHFAGSALLDANKKVRVEGDGAVIVPGANVVTFMVNNPVLGGGAKNAAIEGFDIVGTARSGQTGVLVRDCGNNLVRNVRTEKLATGFHLQSFADGEWAESNQFEHLLAYDCDKGFFADRANDYSSFSQTHISGLNITHCDVGFDLGPTADLFRSRIMLVTIWVPDGAVGFHWQGGMQGAIVDMGFERSGTAPAVNRRAVVIAETAESLPLNAYLHLNFVGGEPDPWTALIDDPFNKGLAYIDRGMFMADGASSALNVRVTGDVASRFRVDPASNRIVLGDGSGVGAVTLRRSAADVLTTDDAFEALGAYVRPPVKTDATRGAPGPAGAVIYNTTDTNLNISDGANWRLPTGEVT